MPNLVSNSDFGTYLGKPSIDNTDTRATFILAKAQILCESIVTPLPAGAEIVVLDVAERAYANPTNVAGNELGIYSEGVGTLSTDNPGTVGGGLWLTQENKATLRRLAGIGGAFTVDTTPDDAGTGLPWWDTGASAWPFV